MPFLSLFADVYNHSIYAKKKHQFPSVYVSFKVKTVNVKLLLINNWRIIDNVMITFLLKNIAM